MSGGKRLPLRRAGRADPDDGRPPGSSLASSRLSGKFIGYRFRRSDYSAITCIRCGACWRTKADYASELDGLADSERFISARTEGASHLTKFIERSRDANNNRL